LQLRYTFRVKDLDNNLNLRKGKIMLVLGMIFAVVVATLAEVGAISNKLA